MSSRTPCTWPSTPLTRSSTLCVIFSCSADAIRASSSVNLSNLSRLPSISLFPINFQKYFSEIVNQSARMIKNINHINQLTESSTLYFLRRDRKDGQHLNHNLN